jgi:hypothetical protein
VSAAPPSRPSDATPVPWTEEPDDGLLPAWYMPAATARVRGRGRRTLIAGIVLGLIVINSVGLCVTYGIAEIAW